MPAHIPSMGRTLFDFPLYGEVSRQRTGRTIGYFALLLFVTSLILAATVTLQLRGAINKYVIPELHKLPVITIKNGQASANVEQPWIRSFDDENNGTKMILVIDTTGKVTGFQPNEQGFILTRTQLLMKNLQNGQSPTLELKDVDDTVIDATCVKKWIPWVLAGTFAAVLICAFVWYVFAKLFFALILSVVGLIAAAATSRKIGYGRILTIAMYAITPAIALDLLEGALNLNVPHFWLIYTAVGCVYTVLAVRAAPDDALPPPPASPVGGPPSATVQPQPPQIF